MASIGGELFKEAGLKEEGCFLSTGRSGKKETTQKQKLMNWLHSVKSLVNIPIANAKVLFVLLLLAGMGFSLLYLFFFLSFLNKNTRNL